MICHVILSGKLGPRALPASGLSALFSKECMQVATHVSYQSLFRGYSSLPGFEGGT